MAEADSSEQADLQAHMEHLHGRARPFGFVQTVLVTDENARVLAGAPEDLLKGVIGKSYPYREWFNGEQDVLDEKEKPREPRRTLGLTLAYESTQEDRPMLIALATPVWAGDTGGGAVLGVLQGTIDLKKFNQWLVDVETKDGDGECPIRFSLLLNRDQLIRHPCPGEYVLPEDDYGNEPSVAKLLESGAVENFRDPFGPGAAYFAASSASSRTTPGKPWCSTTGSRPSPIVVDGRSGPAPCRGHGLGRISTLSRALSRRASALLGQHPQIGEPGLQRLSHRLLMKRQKALVSLVALTDHVRFDVSGYGDPRASDEGPSPSLPPDTSTP